MKIIFKENANLSLDGLKIYIFFKGQICEVVENFANGFECDNVGVTPNAKKISKKLANIFIASKQAEAIIEKPVLLEIKEELKQDENKSIVPTYMSENHSKKRGRKKWE